MEKKSLTEVTPEMIKAVRKETRAGTIDCRKALEASKGDISKAIEFLRANGKGTPNKVWV